MLSCLLVFSCTGLAKPADETTGEASGQSQGLPGTDSGAGINYDVLGGMKFIISAVPQLVTPPGIGEITKDQRDPVNALSGTEKTNLSARFKDAYIDALLLDLPINGVLGGDFVHGWPANSPGTWIQNWRSSENFSNSWGIPSLILATYSVSQERVFIVSGGIMDTYGKSAGVNHANGVKGYGSPRTDEFVYQGMRAQRFDLGLIRQNEKGTLEFIQEDPPTAQLEAPPMTGELRNAPGDEQAKIKQIFLKGWSLAVDRNMPPLIPDRPVAAYDLTAAPWTYQGQIALPFQVHKIYIQSFNNETLALVYIDSPSLPAVPRIIESPFLEILASASTGRIPGSPEFLTDKIKPEADDAFTNSLLLGFDTYGIPLTDTVLKNDKISQRFTFGWMEAE